MTMQEVEQSVKEIWALFRATDARLEKLFKETRADFKDTDAKFKETAAGFKEVEARFNDTDKKIKELTDLFISPWEKIIDSLSKNGIFEILLSRGINVTTLARELKSYKNSRYMGFDFLLSSTDEVVVGQVRTTLDICSIKTFLEELTEFFLFFSFYKGFKIYGAVIGVRIQREVIRFAERNGLFVLKGDGQGMLQLLNDVYFKPKDFSLEAKMKL